MDVFKFGTDTVKKYCIRTFSVKVLTKVHMLIEVVKSAILACEADFPIILSVLAVVF